MSSAPRRTRQRLLRRLVPLVCLAIGVLGAVVYADPVAQGLERLMAPPGTRHADQPSLLRPDYYLDFDRRLPLDTVVYSIENGARCARVLGKDSLWAVDYTWVYPHQGLPSRWYDVNDLLRVGDSVGLGDTSNIVVTFGTCRTGVRAGSFPQARSEANRLRPTVLSEAFFGRLRLKLERAKSALRGGKPAAPGTGPR